MEQITIIFIEIRNGHSIERTAKVQFAVMPDSMSVAPVDLVEEDYDTTLTGYGVRIDGGEWHLYPTRADVEADVDIETGPF